MTFGKPCPDARCGDCDLDDGAEQYPLGVVPGEQRRSGGAGAVHHDDTGEAGKQLGLVPAGYLPVLVRTDNKVERGAGVQGLDAGERVNCIRWAGSAFLNPAQFEPRFSGNRQSRHCQPVTIQGHRAALVRRAARRNEQHPVQAHPEPNVIGYEQVSEMNGVKRAAEHAESERHVSGFG
jgi:hypothetical protein